MRYLLSLSLITISFSSWGHGGGIDRCGGHNDRKAGTYHVHQYNKYCKCNPKAKRCSNRQKLKDKNSEKTKK